MKRDWLQQGSEPSISELLDDPTTHTIMRHDGLRAEQIWKVVDKARRKLVRRAAARKRTEKGEAKQRSIRDDPGLPTATDLNLIDSLGEWPDMFGATALQRPEPDSYQPALIVTHCDQLEPRGMRRPTQVAARFPGRDKPPFRKGGYMAKSSNRIAVNLSQSG